MNNIFNPKFIESALSDFQVVSNNLTGDPFARADIIRCDTDAHMLQLNKAYATGNREKFFALFQEILKQEQDSNE
jgi:hypothetical protein